LLVSTDKRRTSFTNGHLKKALQKAILARDETSVPSIEKIHVIIKLLRSHRTGSAPYFKSIVFFSGKSIVICTPNLVKKWHANDLVPSSP
jgi:hypothetical protein